MFSIIKFRVLTIFFSLLIFSSISVLAMETEIHLYSSSTEEQDIKENKAVVQYADSLVVDDDQYSYEYSLKYPIDKTFAKEAWDYSTIDTNHKSEKNHFRKSHILVNGFNIYSDEEDEVVCEYGRFTTNTFTKTNFYKGALKPTSDLPIDWMSAESICLSLGEKQGTGKENKIYHKRSNKAHSEPQIIDDIEDLLKTDSQSLVKLLTPSPSKKAKKVIMSGLELYGSLDMCTECLGRLVTFRKKHQYEGGKGKERIGNLIADDLQGKGLSFEPQNLFVIIYHAYSPYGTYYVNHEGKYRRIQCNVGKEYFDIKEKADSLVLKDTVLSQYPQKQVLNNPSFIYGHIHNVFDERTMKYAQGKFPDIFIYE